MKTLSFYFSLLLSLPLHCVYETKSIKELYRAVLKNKLSVVRGKIDKYPSLGIAPWRSRNNNTALHVAAQYSDSMMMKALMPNLCIDKEVRNDWGDTPLIIAAYYNNTEAVTVLLAEGARIDAADNDGCTPLYIAVSEGFLDVARILLDAGANPNAEDGEGRDILLAASIGCGGQAMVELVKAYISESDKEVSMSSLIE